MSEEILSAVEEHAQATKKGFDKVLADQAGISARLRHAEQVLADFSGSIGTSHTATPQRKFANALRDNESLDALRSRSVKSARLPMRDLNIKEATGILVNDNSLNNSNYGTQPQRAEGIYNDPRRPLTLIEALAAVPVKSNVFEYVALDGFTDAADYQLTQGAAKAEQDLTTDVKSANIATIAVLQRASEQVLADEPMLLDFLAKRMGYAVAKKLEYELINGTAGTGKIKGLLAHATTFTPSVGAPVADAIGEAIAELDTFGWQAGAVVISPKIWQEIRSERNSSGEYVATGWNQPSQPNIWGVPLIVSAAMGDSDVLVIDPNQVSLLDRREAYFELGFSDDDFAKNLVTARAELRAGLAVYAPTAVQKISLPIAGFQD